MFALDQTNYARWLSVHIRDMCELPVQHRDVFQRFCGGSFMVHKTEKPFSSIALDHAHEQLNYEVKVEGGAVGLRESPAALGRSMVGGPEVARMTRKFEDSAPAPKYQHHEQTPATQTAFAKDVLNAVSSFEDLGNPFNEKSKELIAVHTKDVADETIVNTVMNVVSIGEAQFNTFVQERFINRSKPVTHTIKKNKLPTFITSSMKGKSKDKEKIEILKEDCALFSRLYTACQSRDGNLEDFGHPPFLTWVSYEKDRRQILSSVSRRSLPQRHNSPLWMQPYLCILLKGTAKQCLVPTLKDISSL